MGHCAKIAEFLEGSEAAAPGVGPAAAKSR